MYFENHCIIQIQKIKQVLDGTAHCSMRPTHTLIGILLWSNYTIVEKDIHVLAGVVEDALHSRAQEIGKIK